MRIPQATITKSPEVEHLNAVTDESSTDSATDTEITMWDGNAMESNDEPCLLTQVQSSVPPLPPHLPSTSWGYNDYYQAAAEGPTAATEAAMLNDPNFLDALATQGPHRRNLLYDRWPNHTSNGTDTPLIDLVDCQQTAYSQSTSAYNAPEYHQQHFQPHQVPYLRASTATERTYTIRAKEQALMGLMTKHMELAAREAIELRNAVPVDIAIKAMELRNTHLQTVIIGLRSIGAARRHEATLPKRKQWERWHGKVIDAHYQRITLEKAIAIQTVFNQERIRYMLSGSTALAAQPTLAEPLCPAMPYPPESLPTDEQLYDAQFHPDNVDFCQDLQSFLESL
jgi:hypothetical protein